MSHSDYQPKNSVLAWIERRLPIFGFMHGSFVSYPVPRNLNYWWTFGGILSFMLVVQIITGVVLVAFVLSSIAPLSSSTEWLQTLSPLYYYSGSTPLVNGLDPVHLGVLVVLAAVAVVVGIWAFDHRDLRA